MSLALAHFQLQKREGFSSRDVFTDARGAHTHIHTHTEREGGSGRAHLHSVCDKDIQQKRAGDKIAGKLRRDVRLRTYFQDHMEHLSYTECTRTSQRSSPFSKPVTKQWSEQHTTHNLMHPVPQINKHRNFTANAVAAAKSAGRYRHSQTHANFCKHSQKENARACAKNKIHNRYFR